MQRTFFLMDSKRLHVLLLLPASCICGAVSRELMVSDLFFLRGGAHAVFALFVR